MHAVFVTLSSSAYPEALRARHETYAQGLNTVSGLVATTWMADGPTLGWFHLFDGAGAADDFLTDDLFATIRSDPRFGAFEVRRFDVLDDLSVITGSPSGATHH